MLLKTINGPTIEAGESLSNAVDCTAGQLVAITMPNGWTNAQGNKNVCLTFEFSPDGEVFSDLCTLDGYAVTVPLVVNDSTVVIPADVGRATAWLKIRSGIKGDPVAQEEARTFTLSIMETEKTVPVYVYDPVEGPPRPGLKPPIRPRPPQTKSERNKK